ncbi:MAG: biopolymer transporter ExbD [Spirochaetia bacterium]|nr:biopolymer transporter ExbD [Spirochaetia bacterium]
MRTKLSLKSGIELAPMVDIVFLLVAYFLINSTLIRNPAIKIELPKAETAQSEVEKKIIIHVTGDNKIFLNEKEVTLTNLPVEIKKLITDRDKDHVIIRGDKNASYESIVSVMDYVHQAGITHFNLATEPK